MGKGREWAYELTCSACIALAEDRPDARSVSKRLVRTPWRWSGHNNDASDYDGFSFIDRGPSGGDSDADDDDDDDDDFDDDDDGSGGGTDSFRDDSGDGSREGGRFGAQRGLSIDFEKANSIRNIHGILAAVLFVGVFPLGAILMRVAKRHVWLHAGVQVVALGAYVAAAGMGIWLALYIQPMLWVLMAILALVRLQFLWLPLVGTLDRIPTPLESVIQIQRARFVSMPDSVPLTLVTSYCSCPHHHEHSSLLAM